MNKVMKVVVVAISVFLLTLPAYAESAQEQGAQETARVEVGQEAAKAEAKPETAKAEAKPESAKAEAPREPAKEQTKGLDEQVQEIKADVLSIATQLSRLEEKLLYPSDTQIAIFVSVAGAEKFRLDAVAVELDGKPVAHHLYTFKELEALQKGGVQRIHVGNAMTGEHPLQVKVMGKTEGGSDFQRTESFKVAKGIGPKLVEVVLTGSKTITVKDW
uniref:AraC family transcriptional regulator n=1 Tax=Geobacter sp. (strain M21) TaxID=443144 RepID=C6DZ16_GEOSM